MKITENSTGTASKKRVDVSDTPPSQGFSNVSQSDDLATNMNAPEMHKREWRTDQLVEATGEDSYRTGNEPPRHTKMKG